MLEEFLTEIRLEDQDSIRETLERELEIIDQQEFLGDNNDIPS